MTQGVEPTVIAGDRPRVPNPARPVILTRLVLVVVVLVVVVGVLVVAWPATVGGAMADDGCVVPGVDCEVSVDPGAGAVDLGIRSVRLDHLRTGDGPVASGGAPACRYEPVADGWDPVYHVVDRTSIPWGARFFWLVCDERRALRWYLSGRSDPVTSGALTELVQEAVDRIAVVAPRVALSPPVERFQVTGLATWLSIGADAWQRSVGAVDAGGVRVEAWLEPREVVWRLGNGDTLVCDGPGNVYDPAVPYGHQVAACAYTYTSTPRDLATGGTPAGFEVSAAVRAAVGYRVSGVDGLDGAFSLGEVTGPPAQVLVEVREWRAVRTAGVTG